MKHGLQASCGYFEFEVCGPNFSAPNKVKIGKYIAFRLFFGKVAIVFTWNVTYKLIGGTFVGV